LRPDRPESELRKAMFKIETLPDGQNTVLRLIGRIRAEHLQELKTQIRDDGPTVKLDLEEVTLVDVDVVRFLATCEKEGSQLVHCPPYIREWISRGKNYCRVA